MLCWQFVKIDGKLDKAAVDTTSAAVLNAHAAPTIETAVYMSRVERARMANALKRQ